LQQGIQVKSVAAALEIHPCMLSKWRKPPEKSHPLLFRSKGDIFAFNDTHRVEVGVTALCRRYLVALVGLTTIVLRQPTGFGRQPASQRRPHSPRQ